MWISKKRFLELEKRVADLEETVQRVLPDFKVIAQRFQEALSDQISATDMDHLRERTDESYQKKYVTEQARQSALCDTDEEHTKS